MKKLFTLLVAVLFSAIAFSQCPSSTLSTNSTCLNDNPLLTLNGADATNAAQIQWQFNGNTVATANARYISGTTVAGGNGFGLAANQLRNPGSVFVDASGNLYVGDNERIQKWAPGATIGVTVAGGNGYGSAANQLTFPTVYVDASANVYVSDYSNNRVQKWAPGATEGIIVAGGNGYGSAANQLYYPNGVAVDASGNVYVSDSYNNRVQKWAPGATLGITVAGGNGYGSAANQLSSPTGVTLDASGYIYVSDSYNNRVQKWAPGATAGVTIAGGNGYGSAANQLSSPTGVALDTSGNIYVGDDFNNRIQKWAPGATSGVTVAGGYDQGSAANQFSGISSVCVDALGNVYVADRNNNRIQKWGLQTPTTYYGIHAGIYTAIVTSAAGCSVQATGSVIVSDCFTLSSVSGTNIQTVCGEYKPINTITYATVGATGATFSGLPTGVTGSWANNIVTISGTPTVSGTFNYTVTLTGTTPVRTARGSIIISAFPVALTANSTCLKDNPLLTLNGADATNAAQIQWQLNGNTVATVNATYPSSATVAGGNSLGWNSNQFIKPNGLIVDTLGNIYVSDDFFYSGQSGRIQKWAPGATEGITLAEGSNSYNSFKNINGIYLAPSGNMYVCDYTTSRIQKMSQDFTSSTTVAGANVAGSASNQLNQPRGVCVDAVGNVYVSDAGNHRIQKWAPGATEGITVAGTGVAGATANQLNSPRGVFVDVSGNIYVNDGENYRIQKWAPGATAGVTVAGGNGSGPATNQFSCDGMFIDGAGNIYISDNLRGRIMKWVPGATAGIITGTGGYFNQNYITDPYNNTGLWVDGAGNIYFTNPSDLSVQKASPQIVKTFTATAAGTYTAIVTNLAGCTATTNSSIVVTENTISLTLLVGTVTQTSCINSAITNRTYATTGATGATFSGLPTGVAGSWANNVVTISGTPTVAGTFNYTITLTGTGVCTSATATGSILVNTLPVSTLTSSSIVLTDNPMLSLSGDAANADQIQWLLNGSNLATSNATYSTGTTVAGGNGQGAAANQLAGVKNYVDALGNIYVADEANQRIQKWIPGATVGITVAGGNGQGSAANQFNGANSVFVDASGNIYVADRNNNRIQKWAPNAIVGVTVAGGNGPGNTTNQLNFPTGVFLDALGNVYVNDSRNNRIQKWAPNATVGVTVAGGNGQGFATNQLYLPAGVHVDAFGNVYVADRLNNRIQKWAPNASVGVTVAGGNGQGSAVNQLNYPASVYVDGAGNVYIADQNNHRIQKWIPYATEGSTVAGTGVSGSTANELNIPLSVFVDASGNMYIGDLYNYRVQKWERITATTYNAGTAGTYTALITNSNGCSAKATNSIIVNSTVTPTFTQIASICSGAGISALPTTSNNGITGTWSPAFNNVATTTYVFTPAAGQNASTASMTITVTPTVIPAFMYVNGICSGSSLSALPTTSNNSITGTWTPALNNTTRTLYTFTPTAGQCATTATMTIDVYPTQTPTFTQISAICSGGYISGLPITATNDISGTWSPTFNNLVTTEYTFTPDDGQCATTATMTIEVYPTQTPTFTQVSAICSGGNLSALPLTSLNGITGTWTPALNNLATTEYTFTPYDGQCAITATMTITIIARSSNTTTESACKRYTWSVNGDTYTNSGRYLVSTGCHTEILNLTIQQPTSSIEILSACGSISWHGNTYSASTNSPTWTGVNAAGCDSVVTLNLTTFQPTSSTTTITNCVSYIWNGTTYATSGIYTKTLTNVSGCDSVAYLILTINQPTLNTEIISACGLFSWHGNLYTASTNSAKWTGVNAAGCDSVVTLNLTIISIPLVPTATVTQPTCTTSTGTITVTSTKTGLAFSINSLSYANTTGVFTGIAPGTYSLTAKNTLGCTSSVASVTVIAPKCSSIGNFVFRDNNANGIQDLEEPGIAGVSIRLLNSSGAQIATTTTNSNGIYGFANLAAGTYTVSFNTPAGFTPTLGKVGSNDNTDSDPIGGSVSNITLAQSQANTRVDAGFIPSILKLGDRVWYDANNDGNLNSGENGMRNIIVRLYADIDNNNVADGASIATTTTNSTGNYLFTSLAPGNYIVGVVMPAGYMSSIVNGSDPDNNIDNDDNGQLLIGNEIRGLAITLNLGAEFDGTKMNSNTNNTYDFGLLPDCNCINTSGNLLTNGSFESGTTGWTASGGSVSSGTGYIACGSKNGFNSTATSGKLSIVYQDVVTALGTTLTLNAFAGAHTAGLTCSPKLSLIFLNAAGKVLCQNDVAVTQDVDANFGQLSMYTISAKAPIGATKARVQSSTTCNTLKLDAFCLRVASNTFAKDQSSPVKSTEPLPKELNVTASPNPVVGLFNLSVSSSDKITPVNIRILNIDGKILSIKKTAANSTLKIDAAKWLSGIYIAEVIQGKQSKVIKLVKTN